MAVPTGVAQADPDGLTDRIDDASRKLAVVIEQYNALRDDLATTDAQTRILAEQIEPLEEELARAGDRVGQLARLTFRTRGATVSAVLDAGSAGELADRLLLLDRIARDEQRQIAALQTAREKYDTARRTLQALADQQRELESALADKRDRIESEIAQLEADRRQAMAQGTMSSPDPVPPSQRPEPPAGELGTLIDFAYDQLGKPYQWATAGPDGYDCSGLTKAVWSQAGVELPHSSKRQWQQAEQLERNQLRAGDLVFYYDDISHVALYVGADLVLHAPTFGEQVRLSRVDHAPVFGFGRVG